MKHIYGFITLIILSLYSPAALLAQTAPNLGTAQSFALLAGTQLISIGSTSVTGNVGVSPGNILTGLLSSKITSGTTYTGSDPTVVAAQKDALTAYDVLANATGGTNLSGKTLGKTSGAVTLTPGVYTFTSSAALSGTLTLNDGGNPNAVFIFKIGSSLTTAASSKVVMTSGGNGANVFWQVGTSVTTGISSVMRGNILAGTSITMNLNASTTGRLFALTGGLIMNSNISAVPVLQVIDTDGDGIADILDDYPNDATKAFDNYSSTGAGSTVAFEDQWPSKGDFDFNDIVMQYKYDVVTNAQNVVVQVIGNFSLLASGTGYNDGFGVQFPIPSSSVSGVTGGTLESGQTNAVITLFDNVRALTTFQNTQPGVAKSLTPLTFTVSFDVANGPTLSTFGTDYNPFLYLTVNKLRYEVHLPGKPPTDLADKTHFGTGDDATNLATKYYYYTKTGLPFAICVPATFNYPTEETDISKAYLHFADWATSGGTLYLDWYSNLDILYRATSLIYTK